MAVYRPEDIAIFVTGILHPEGIAFDAEGWLYTGSAAPDHTGRGPIYRVSPDGKVRSRFADTGGRVLGLAFDQAGSLFACDVALGAVFKLNPQGECTLFAERAGKRKLQKPNFLAFDRRGFLYVSDSGTAKAGEPTGAIFRFNPEGQGEVFIDHLVFPNGIAFSPDYLHLYVVLTKDNQILRVPIEANGAAGAPEIFARGLESGPDGIAFDSQGNLYVTITRPSQIVQIAPDGQRTDLIVDLQDQRIQAPSNLAFGGPNRSELYIANLFGSHISKVTVNIPGPP